MKQRTASRLAWGLVALTLASMSVSPVMEVSRDPADLIFVVLLIVGFGGFASVGALIVSRQPGNTMGWLFLMGSVGAAVLAVGDSYPGFAVARGWPGAVWAAWVGEWVWLLVIGPLFVFFPLLFPDGRLPSRRWRAYPWLAGGYLALNGLGYALDPGPVPDSTLAEIGAPNPLGVEAFRGAAELSDGPGLVGFIALAVASSTSLVLRFRRSDREARQQIKWFLVAAGFLVVLIVVAGLEQLLRLGLPEWVGNTLWGLGLLGLPVATGIAILRHRLYDIDVVINRALVFAILAGLITAVYVGVVVGIGALVGARANTFLTILAAVVIAVAFHPLRERARHLANRVVYGKRATPYELLSEFADRLGVAYSTEDVLPRIARVVGEGTGASRAGVWLRVGNEVRPAAWWPGEGDPRPSPALRGEDLPPFPEGERAFPVRHHGELLGALTMEPRPGEALTPAQEKLLSDVAAQAGLILRNVRLIEELRASRQRLVRAQDEERRRLERNIHDGAQQQLVALAVNLNLARTLTVKDPARAASVLDRLKDEAREALEDLRDLARGIYPPLLADKGLSAALEAQARKAPMPVVVEANGVGRYPQEVEAAVYFCALEALQNAAKYAEAFRVTIRLRAEEATLAFEVADDGRGFDQETTPRGSGLQNMADRLEALGGGVKIDSRPGAGTTVAGRIPIRTVAP